MLNVVFQQTFLVGYPSLLAHHLSHALNNPLITLYSRHPLTNSKQLIVRPFYPLSQSLPCDVYLVNLRFLDHIRNATQSLLLLHRVDSDCHVQAPVRLNCDTYSNNRVCSAPLFHLFHSSSLTLLSVKSKPAS